MCDLHGSVWVLIPLAIFFIYLIFKFICALVDEYIAESLTYIQEYLKISEALAGVTILALANGAGDVVTAIVASGSSEGVSYNIGALFGAGLFVCAIVICLTILQSKEELVVNANTVYRDIGFYLAGGLLVLFYAWYGKIPWWGAVSMLILYFVLVIVVWI
jgi:sodium/potassium/calcium exchanger 6